jgi:hypothetical protein
VTAVTGVLFDNASFFGQRTGRGRKADKGRDLPVGNYRPREAVVVERDAGEALDAALAAFMGAIEDQG